MRYFMVCGERSGDLHASNLLKELKNIDPEAEVHAIGGEQVQSEGAHLLFHYREMAFMGFAEIIQSIPKILRFLSKTNDYIRTWRPDVVILIDYGGFNLRLAKKLFGSGIKVFYYITPKVWAWNSGRVKSLALYTHQLYVILPFETDFFKKFGLTAHYVGNPVLDAVHGTPTDHQFVKRHNISVNRTCIAILPGSRKQEVKQMMQILPDLCSQFPEYTFLIAGVNNLDKAHYQAMALCHNGILIMDDTYQLLLHCKAAVVTSGTATLETALLGIPQVVVYRTSAVSYTVAKLLVKIKYISLVNLIADKAVVHELIQEAFTAENIKHHLQPLLLDSEEREEQLSDIGMLKNTMGEPGASKKAAHLMIEHLRK